MSILSSLGLDENLLDESEIKSIVDASSKMNLTGRIDPNMVLNTLRSEGVDIDRIIKKMRGNVETKKSTRVKRNVLCPCKSGKKYKKCCGFLKPKVF